MTFRDALQQAWAVASGRAVVAGQIRTYRVDGASHDARGALSSEGDIGLLLALGPGESFVPSVRLQPGRGGALEAEVAPYREQGVSLVAVTVWCRDQALRVAFLAFCESLLERTSGGASVGKALDECHAEFVRLVASPPVLDPRVLTGLLGELLVLAELVERDPTVATAWAGRDRERNDFRRSLVALEVKTAARASSSTLKVHISSLDQLVRPDGGHLFLHAIHLERSDVGELSLATLVERIRGRVTGVARDALEEGLASYTRDHGDRRTFTVLARRTFEIRESFPSLVPARLIAGRTDHGVKGVEYDLELSAAETFAIEWDVAINALLQGARA